MQSTKLLHIAIQLLSMRYWGVLLRLLENLPNVIWATAKCTIITTKCGNRNQCECIATWGHPTPCKSFSSLTKTHVSSLKSVNLPVAVCIIAFSLLIRYVIVTLTFDLWPLTSNICSIWSNSIPNLSKIEQSAAVLWRSQYFSASCDCL